ncbi:uncharacterized protein RJT21DRAFT_84966 [Scheffersomyces amazonensis]|uniref:uncharacterized protein n=1 Tax=Scheffersomyces amazonensis TaxID=1078765 RepID=UPI00315D377B
MSYDPIHDTYVPKAGPETAGALEEPVSNKSNGLSISDLVSSPNTKATAISNLINKDNEEKEGDRDREEEGDEEEEDDEEYESDINVNTHSSANRGEPPREVKSNSSRKRKRKYTNSTIPKCRHLKKADGEPFWRKDIQYDFLHALFNDDTPCFTNSFPHTDLENANNNPKIPFSDLYIRTLAESSKCSKILKERLIKDKRWSLSVAKVCLLVNAGRMNTTINFVPEMRSTLRTYHSIPSLQADPLGHGSIQLQDTPRLKSILKAVCEDDNKPRELDEILNDPSPNKPNTNVFQLIFLLSNRTTGIPYHHEDLTVNLFMEFFLNPKIHPTNRAKRFLWLLYTYLETDFSQEQIANNPFGGGKIPNLEYIPEYDLNRFDIDTDFEIDYSESMFAIRNKYLKDETNVRRRVKRDDHDEYDSETVSDVDGDKTKVEESKSNHSKKKRVKRIPTTAIPSPLAKTVFTSNEKNGTKKEIVEETVEQNNNAEFINNKINFKVEAIQFPIDNLYKLVKSYGSNSLQLNRPNEDDLISTLRNVLNESKPIIRDVRTSSKASTASFNKKTTILGSWIYRYFKYKKSIGNKLLGMEWEEIRYDIVNGLENYIYQQFGKSLLANITSQELKEDSPIEKAPEFDDIFTYLPQYDFSHIQEKNTFILQLMTFCDQWFIKKLKDDNNKLIYPRDKITFDLDNNSIKIKD